MSKNWIVGVIFIITGLFFGLIQELFFTELDELYYIDFWSIAHFNVPFGLFLIFSSFMSDKISMILSITLVFIWEGIERLSIYINPNLFDYGYEITGNIIMDIVLGITGISIAYILNKKGQCEIVENRIKCYKY